MAVVEMARPENEPLSHRGGLTANVGGEGYGAS
jgi:hypothetical protein